MARTFQNAIDRARIPLNDDDKDRYTDVQLLSYANDAILILRQKRPDLFFGAWTPSPTEYILSDNLPVDDRYFPAVADYVTARAETRDDEDAMQARAASFMTLFGSNI